MLLGMVEKKVSCRQKGEHSQRQRHLGESRVDMTLSHVKKGEGVETGEKEEPSVAAKREKDLRRWGGGE